MDIDRVSFEPLANGGDDVTGALVKLDQNCADLADAIGSTGDGVGTLAQRVGAVEDAIDGLGGAAALNVGTVAGTVAAGDDARFLRLGGLKGKAINGAMDVWQNGTSLSTAGSLNAGRELCDRISVTSTGASTNAQSQGQFTTSDYALPLRIKARYYLKVDVTSGGTSSSRTLIGTKVLGVRSFAGNKMTVSFLGKASANGLKMTVTPYQSFGTGGSPSALLLITPQIVTLTTSWARYTATFDMPAITGKVLGTAMDDAVFLNFYVDAGADFSSVGAIGTQSGSFYIAELQPEEGAIATDFEYRPEPLERAMCLSLRYRITGPASGYRTIGSANGGGGSTLARLIVPFPVQMLAAPTVTFFGSMAAYPGQTGPVTLASSPIGAVYPANDQFEADLAHSISTIGGQPYKILLAAGSYLEFNTGL